MSKTKKMTALEYFTMPLWVCYAGGEQKAQNGDLLPDFDISGEVPWLVRFVTSWLMGWRWERIDMS